jgi:hypothetical protein
MKKSIPNLPSSSRLNSPSQGAKTPMVGKTAKMGKATASVGKNPAASKMMSAAKGKGVKMKKGY